MAIRHDAIRHHLANDNVRLREALKLIGEMCAGQPNNDMTRHIARIARNALLSAAPENKALASNNVTPRPSAQPAGDEAS